jgi:Tfp pilus assembly protein PilP
MKKLIIIVLAALSVGAVAAPAEKKLSEFFKDKTRLENPLELRDPFKAPPVKSESTGGRNYSREGQNNYSNIKLHPVTDLNIHELRVVGVLIGKERRALINPNQTSKDVIVVKEGMKIGRDQAELKAILPGGIILVEKIINVYGQEEYLETVIPISR